MRIIMIPGLCSNEYRNTGGSFCTSCFSAFLMHGCQPDRPCITEVEDDGREEVTLVLRYANHEKILEITDENRESIAYGDWEGWVKFVQELPSEPIA